MDERAELESLRARARGRLAELEAKASGKADTGWLKADETGFLDAMMIGAGKTTKRLGQGMQQLYYGATGDKAGQARLDGDVAEENRLYAPLKESNPWATGIGEALPSMAVPVGAAATVLGRVGSMAAAGAAPGLLEHGSAGDRFKRGLIGSAAGAALPLGVAGVKTLNAAAEPLYRSGRERIVSRTLNRAAGADAQQVAQRMSQAGELVPGSAPTAAQVAQSGGIAAIERSAGAANPQAYTQRSMEQASARLSALRGIAGDDAAIATAKASRAAASDPLYAAADAGVAPVDGYFTSLLKRPQFERAVSRAQELAKNGGLEDIFFRDPKGNPTALLGEGAHFIKKALDEAAEFGSSSYTGKASAKAAGQTNEMFQEWLGKSIPEYGAARDAFAAGSKPINQMQVGQSLLDAVNPALADFGALGRETGATYARALRNADQTAAKAVGMPGKKMADVLTPQQLATVEAVGKDLGRKANAQDLGRGVGSDTFQKLAMQNVSQQSGMPGAVGGLLGLPGVSRATAWAFRDADQAMQEMLAQTLLDPKKAAELMKRTAPKQRGLLMQAQQELLQQSLLRAGLLGAPAASQAVAPGP